MKKTLFTNLVVLLVMILGGGNTAWAVENEVHDFPQTLSQLLNENASIQPITIDAQSYPIKEVIVVGSYNKTTADAVTIAVTVGTTQLATQNVGGKNSFTKTFNVEPNETGAVTIDFTNNLGSGTGHGTFTVTKVTLVEGSATLADDDAGLSFVNTTLELHELNAEFDLQLNNPRNLPITYTSSNEDVAAVIDGTGLTGDYGTAIITASIDNSNGTYTKNTSVSLTVNVTEAIEPQTYSEIDLTGKTTPVEFEKAWDNLGSSYSATEQTKTIKSKTGDSYENWKFVNCITGSSSTAHVDWLQMNNKSGRSCKATLPTIKSDYGFKVTVVAVNSNGDVNVKMNGVVGNEYVSNATEATVYIEPSANGAIYISTVTVTPLPAPVVLSDASDYSPVAATGVNVQLNRKMVAGWNGVTLPFAISEDVKTALGASEVKTLGTATEANDAVTLNFVDATLPVAAGTPVLVKLTETKESALIPNVDIETTAPTTVAKTAAGNTFTLTGNYVSTDLTTEETYFVAGTTFNHKAADVALTAKPFRAYIVQTAEAGAQARTVRFNLGDGEATGIREVATATTGNGLTYNLQGQRISRATKGVYIVNGKKTIVK